MLLNGSNHAESVGRYEWEFEDNIQHRSKTQPFPSPDKINVKMIFPFSLAMFDSTISVSSVWRLVLKLIPLSDKPIGVVITPAICLWGLENKHS